MEFIKYDNINIIYNNTDTIGQKKLLEKKKTKL